MTPDRQALHDAAKAAALAERDRMMQEHQGGWRDEGGSPIPTYPPLSTDDVVGRIVEAALAVVDQHRAALEAALDREDVDAADLERPMIEAEPMADSWQRTAQAIVAGREQERLDELTADVASEALPDELVQAAAEAICHRSHADGWTKTANVVCDDCLATATDALQATFAKLPECEAAVAVVNDVLAELRRLRSGVTVALTLTDYKQVLLDIAKEAGEAFDVADSGGMDAVVDLAMAVRLNRIESKVEEARAFIFSHNVIRLRSLGVDPRSMPGYAEAAKRFMGLDVVARRRDG